MTCEHNLKLKHDKKSKDTKSLDGSLILTNFKVIFKPHTDRLNKNLTEQDLQMLGRSRVRDYFRIPMGLIHSVDVRTYAVTDNKIKHSCIELVTKDQRKLQFIMRDYDEAMQVREIIKCTAFLDNVEYPEKR